MREGESCGCVFKGLLLFGSPLQLLWFPSERIVEWFHDLGDVWEEMAIVVDHTDELLKSFDGSGLGKF